MKNEKVCCKNCKFFKSDGFLGMGEGDERFDCVYKIISQNDVNTGLQYINEPKGCKDYSRVFYKGFFKYEKLNKDNNCKYYKKKWWKIGI